MSLLKDAREKKPKSKTRKIIEWVLFGVFGAAFAFVMAANVSGMIHRNENYGQSIRFGVGSFIILTNSMEPDIKVDDAIITYKEDLNTFKERINNNEIIDVTFANEKINVVFEPDTEAFKRKNGGTCVVSNQIMTHRLREVHEDPSVEFGKGRFIFVASGINTGGVHALEGQYQLFTEKQYLGTVKVVNTPLGKFMNFIASPIGLIILLLVPAGYLIVTSSIDIIKALKAQEEAPTTHSNDSSHLSNISDKDRERLKKEMLEEMIKSKQEAKKDE